MTTKANLIAQLKAENPTMTATINDEKILLSNAEYDKACNDWADMRLQQLEAQAQTDKIATDKAALLAKLGLTADEFKTLLGGN